jgi:hypothetical protein
MVRKTKEERTRMQELLKPSMPREPGDYRLNIVAGGLAKLLGALAGAGANLECVVARRDPSNADSG